MEDKHPQFAAGLCLEASAGSGKTFALVARYLTLLFLRANPSGILVLTFTNKAADEMGSRIEEFLRTLGDHPQMLELVCQMSGIERERILLDRQEIWHRFLSSKTKIMTIDKFVASALRLFATHLGLLGNFSIETTSKSSRIIDFLALVRKSGNMETLVRLSLFESRRMNALFELLLRLYQVGFAIPKQQPIDSKALLAQLAVQERLIGDLCASIIGELDSTIELSDSLRAMFDATDIEALAKKGWLERESLAYWQFKKHHTPRTDELLCEVKKAFADYFRIKERLFLGTLLQMYELFEQSRILAAKNRGRLDFDDLSAFGYRLFAGDQSVDRDFFYFRLDARIEHMLIDEFQDTSTLQYKILEPLIEECVAGIGQKEFKSFFYVGDKKQSIYRFRGANSRLFDLAKESLHLDVQALDANYRCRAAIVEFVNDTFAPQFGGYLPQRANKGGGYVKVKKTSEPIREVVAAVWELLSNGVDASRIAVLAYTNDDLLQISDALYDNFEQLSVVTESSARLTNAVSVRPLIEFFHYLYYGAAVHRANFFTLIGRDAFAALDSERYKRLLGGGLRRAAIAAIDEFALGIDENLFIFLEILDRYYDLDEFIYSLETLDAAQAVEAREGVRLLSVHKSKGLEFDNVIVCDRLGRGRANGDPLLFAYEGLKLVDIKIRYSGRAAFDEEYKKIYDDERLQSENDDKSAHYVAFTRAKDRLFVVAKEKEGAFDALELRESVSGEFDLAQLPLESRVEEIERVSCTATAFGRQQFEREEEGEQQHDAQAIQIGLAAHYFFELLSGVDEESQRDAFWALENKYGSRVGAEQFAVLCERLRRALKSEEFMRLFGASVLKEQPLRFEGRLRRLDFIALRDDEAVVVDFKTGRGQYDAQLREYRTAVEKIWSRPTTAFVAYIGDEFSLEMVR